MRSAELDFAHRFVPARAGGRVGPGLLLLHGTGGDENDLLPLGAELAPGAALLSPRGRVLENGMPRFFQRLAEGVFDPREVEARAQELADFVGGARERYDLGPGKPIAVGFSNGANIAAAVLLLRPEVLGGAILLRPMVPLEPETIPDLRGVRVLIGAGRQDPIASPAQTERLRQLLESAGASVDVNWSSGGHALTAADLTAARAWLR
jgi:phospholipase/carboxylesterase